MHHFAQDVLGSNGAGMGACQALGETHARMGNSPA
jgi:hypothetical protein